MVFPFPREFHDSARSILCPVRIYSRVHRNVRSVAERRLSDETFDLTTPDNPATAYPRPSDVRFLVPRAFPSSEDLLSPRVSGCVRSPEGGSRAFLVHVSSASNPQATRDRVACRLLLKLYHQSAVLCEVRLSALFPFFQASRRSREPQKSPMTPVGGEEVRRSGNALPNVTLPRLRDLLFRATACRK